MRQSLFSKQENTESFKPHTPTYRSEKAHHKVDNRILNLVNL